MADFFASVSSSITVTPSESEFVSPVLVDTDVKLSPSVAVVGVGQQLKSEISVRPKFRSKSEYLAAGRYRE